jgi:predicted transcriptional regulator of viral defense system
MAEVKTQLEQLREVAFDQHGLVTAAQAAGEGVGGAQLAMMVKRNRLQKLARGVYLVPQTPGGRYQNWELAVLWTGAPEACLSHETALAAHEISDINPDQIHVTVGKRRRLRRAGGERYVIHREDLTSEQTTWFEQMPITTVATTIRQCVDWGTPTYLLRQALERTEGTSRLPRADREQLIRRLEERDNGR